MTDEPNATEVCAICGAPLSDAGRYCRFYEPDGPRAFCSPQCAELFLWRPRPGREGTTDIFAVVAEGMRSMPAYRER